MTLLTASEHDPATTITPERFHLTVTAGLKPNIRSQPIGSLARTARMWN